MIQRWTGSIRCSDPLEIQIGITSTIQQLQLKKKNVKDTNNFKTQKNVQMFGYCGRCNRHTKYFLLAVKCGSWEGDTFFPNVGENVEQDAGFQCTWDTEPPTAKVWPTGLASKISNFCWKTTGMRYPTTPRAFENFTLDSSDTWGVPLQTQH